MLKIASYWVALLLLLPLSLSAANGAVGISGVVSLSPELALQASPRDVVYIYAVDSKTRSMTLATLRTTVRKLPLRFTLDDSLAASPERRLSDFSEVDVVARVSRSPISARGGPDLMGVLEGIDSNSAAVELVIDTQMLCVQPVD